jgi:hypothetical protein
MAPKAAPEPPQHLDTLKGMGPRKDSPPPFSRPPPVSEPTTALEREVVRLRAEMASLVDAREKAAKAVPAWVEPPWWRTTGGMVKVLGALFAGLASLGVGGWLASRPEEKPKAPAVTDVACPKFEDQDAPRSALCMRINQLEGSIGKLEAVDAARRERDSRIRKMLGELPEVKTKENP